MILGFDIGNTKTLLGIFEEGSRIPAATYRYRTMREMTSDELTILVRSLIASHAPEGSNAPLIDGIAFSSVGPEVNSRYHRMAQESFGMNACEITARSRLNITINYEEPGRLGVDRIVTAAAVYDEYGGDYIVIDLGTATTFGVVLAGGRFDGGLIGPGIGITIDALAAHTSQLRKIAFEKPASLIARNTLDNLKSGFYYGWLSLVQGVVARIENEYKKEFSVILTGGYAAIMGAAMERKAIVDPLLTMKGVGLVYRLNAQDSQPRTQ